MWTALYFVRVKITLSFCVVPLQMTCVCIYNTEAVTDINLVLFHGYELFLKIL